MIPVLPLLALKFPRLWKWRRPLAYGLAGLCVAWIGVAAWLTVAGWRTDAKALPAARQALEASEAARVAERAQMTAEAARIATLNRGYADEIDTLRTASARPIRSVRLCQSAPPPAGPVAAASAGSGDGPPAGAGELPAAPGSDTGAGPDIGPQLYALMDEADLVVASCRVAQEYIRGLP